MSFCLIAEAADGIAVSLIDASIASVVAGHVGTIVIETPAISGIRINTLGSTPKVGAVTRASEFGIGTVVAVVVTCGQRAEACGIVDDRRITHRTCARIGTPSCGRSQGLGNIRCVI